MDQKSEVDCKRDGGKWVGELVLRWEDAQNWTRWQDGVRAVAMASR